MSVLKSRNTASNALSVLSALAMVAFLVAMLSVAREILVPVALAALLTFLLAPVVTHLERRAGRALSVVLVVIVISAGTAALAWTITGQILDLMQKLPGYEDNIIAKVHALPLQRGKTFAAFSKMLDDLKKEMPSGAKAEGSGASPSGKTPPANIPPPAAPNPPAAGHADPLPVPVPVKVVEDASNGPLGQSKAMLAAVAAPLASAALVLLLLICMLLQREDLRNRIIRVVGQGHISVTTRAMSDAAGRVSRYLRMQFVMNMSYGVLVATGLYFIGIPNAVLWGGFAAVLRYVPYVGIWIAAAFPLVLSLAVSQNWMVPLLTLGLFLALEILCANLLEPLVFGSSTGVSSVALILAALFWAWIWGPAGLVLSTPLTVCLVVIGRHVPRLDFLSVLLSDERALTPAEDLYHRLLAPGDHDETELVDSYLKEHSLPQLYDSVLVPVTAVAGADAQRGVLEPEHSERVDEGVSNILDELEERPAETFERPPASEGDTAAPPAIISCRVLCLPAHSRGDELSVRMLAHLLRLQGADAVAESETLVAGELLAAVEKAEPDVVCIGLVPPSAVSQARYLCLKIRKQFPRVKIVAGLWGASELLSEAGGRLREAGADDVVTSLADAIVAIRKIAPRIEAAMSPAPVPDDEEERLAALHELKLLDSSELEPSLDRITARATRVFEVPIAYVSLVDRDRLYYKSQVGLPQEIAKAGQSPRDVSVCGHLVTGNETVVIEDLARDRRFANNPWLRQHNMRFYAGVPLRASTGEVIGAFCLVDQKPRTFNERDRRQLQAFAAEMQEELLALAPALV